MNARGLRAWILGLLLAGLGACAGPGGPRPKADAPPASSAIGFEWVRTIGSPGTGPAEFDQPTGLAIDHAGGLFVVDQGNNRVQKFDRDGQFLLEFGIFGSEGGQFIEPVQATAAHGFSVAVTDSRNERWLTFDLEGNFLAGSLEEADERLGIPWGIARASDGRLFVSNTQDHTIVVIGLDGAVEFAFGGFGRGLGQLNQPSGVQLSRRQDLFVADAGNHRVQVFDQHGGPLGAWGRRGRGPGEFEGPSGVAVDGRGRVFVADTGNNRVQVFDASRRWLASLPGAGPQGGFLQPYDVAVDGARLVVADTGHDRVLEFRVIDDAVPR